MKPPSSELLPQYAAAFQEYLAGGGEGVLRRAYELGRQALADGLGVLEMAVLIHRAMLSVGPRGRTPEERARVATAIEEFFLECLSPFEMAHRGVREANSALRRHNEMLEEVAKRIAHSLHDEAAQLLVSVVSMSPSMSLLGICLRGLITTAFRKSGNFSMKPLSNCDVSLMSSVRRSWTIWGCSRRSSSWPKESPSGRGFRSPWRARWRVGRGPRSRQPSTESFRKRSTT